MALIAKRSGTPGIVVGHMSGHPLIGGELNSSSNWYDWLAVTIDTTDTDANSSASNQFCAKATDVVGTFLVGWGDGSSSEAIGTNTDLRIFHTYSSTGTYTVRYVVDGLISYSNTTGGGTDVRKWRDIIRYGYNTVYRGITVGNSNMPTLLTSTDSPPLTCTKISFWSTFNDPVIDGWTNQWTDLYYCFANGVFNQSLNNWDLSNCVDVGGIFYSNGSWSQDVSAWDVSNVQNFGAFNFLGNNTNMNIAAWVTSSATNMAAMFRNSFWTFNEDLSAWNVSGVTNFSLMFAECPAFNADLSAWNVGSATNFSSMFQQCLSQTTNFSSWNVSNGVFFQGMFRNCTNPLFNWSINNWNMSNATNTSTMFQGASNWKNGGVDFGSGIGGTLSRSTFASTVTGVTDANTMFSNLSSATTVGYLDFRYSGGSGLNLTSFASLLPEASVIDSLVLWSQNTNISTGVNAVSIFGASRVIDRTTTTALGNTGADAETAENTLTTTYSWTITGISYIN